MIDTSYFIVRSSGTRGGYCYIDYIGLYKLSDISVAAKIDETKLKELYIANGGIYDDTIDSYYFDNMISAQKTISEIFSKIKKSQKGRVVELTEPEIEYIRKALISDGSGFTSMNNKLKDAIFKKLNR